MNDKLKEKKRNIQKLGSSDGGSGSSHEHVVVVEEWFHELMKDLNYLIERESGNENGNDDDYILLISMSVKSIISCYVEFDHEVGYCQGK